MEIAQRSANQHSTFNEHCRVCTRQVLKFVGCYHGHADSFLVQAGSGVATLGLPDSPGVPASSTGALGSTSCLTPLVLKCLIRLYH